LYQVEKPEPRRLKAEVRRLPQASHYVVGLLNSKSISSPSMFIYRLRDIVNYKHNRQLLLSPFAWPLFNFFV